MGEREEFEAAYWCEVAIVKAEIIGLALAGHRLGTEEEIRRATGSLASRGHFFQALFDLACAGLLSDLLGRYEATERLEAFGSAGADAVVAWCDRHRSGT